MITVRHEGPGRDFVILPNDIFSNPNLTGNAVKLLGYLHVHSKIPNWVFRLEHMERVVVGEKALRNARQCLKDNGYLIESSNRASGEFKNLDMIFFSYPITQSEGGSSPGDVRQPGGGSPLKGEHNKTLGNKTLENKTELDLEEKERAKALKKKKFSDSASPRATRASESEKKLEPDEPEPNYAPLHPAGQHPSGEASQVETLPSQKQAARSKNTPRSEAPPLEISEHLQTPEFLDAWADKCQRNEDAPRAKRSSLGNWLKQLEPFTAQEAAFLVRGAMDWMGLNLPSQLASIQKLKREGMWTQQAQSKNMTLPQLLEKHEAVSSERVAFYRRHFALLGQRNGSEFHTGIKSESQHLVEALEKQAYDAEYKASYPQEFAVYQNRLASPSVQVSLPSGTKLMGYPVERRAVEREEIAALPATPCMENAERKVLLDLARQDIEEYGYTEMPLTARELATIQADVGTINF
jgi:hypothetical protein